MRDAARLNVFLNQRRRSTLVVFYAIKLEESDGVPSVLVEEKGAYTPEREEPWIWLLGSTLRSLTSTSGIPPGLYLRNI